MQKFRKRSGEMTYKLDTVAKVLLGLPWPIYREGELRF